MSLAGRVIDAITKAKASLGDLIISATMTKVVNIGYDATTQLPTQTISTKNFEGFIGGWTEEELRGSSVRTDDMKFYIFPNQGADQIKHGNELNVNGLKYKVEKIDPTMVGTQVALWTVQLRK